MGSHSPTSKASKGGKVTIYGIYSPFTGCFVFSVGLFSSRLEQWSTFMGGFVAHRALVRLLPGPWIP